MATVAEMKKWILDYLDMVTPEVREAMIADTRHMKYAEDWTKELTMLSYARRWKNGEHIPRSVQLSIVVWIRQNKEVFTRKTFEPLAQALDKNNPKMLVGFEKLEMEV